jgi:hypothetical protein
LVEEREGGGFDGAAGSRTLWDGELGVRISGWARAGIQISF